MMKTVNVSDSFTLEDIRILRDDFDRRHTYENGNIVEFSIMKMIK